MSFFINNQKHDTYIINDSYFNNYESKVTLPLIEIYNKDIIDFDFSNVKITSLDPNLKDKEIKINKILIDYGDGKQDLLNERLINKSSSIGDYKIKKWQIVSHSFSSDKKHIYEENLSLESHPQITIIFFNQFNDKFYYCIPYKILYKSFYDEGSDLSLISANTNNNNLTSFTLRERKNNTLLFISSKSKMNIDEIIFSNPISLIDETDDYYVDDEDMVWNWSTIPELIILNPIISLNEETKKYDITLEWKEKNVNLLDVEIYERVLGENKSVNVKAIDEDGKIKTSITRSNLNPGVYEYTYNIKGINDISNSQKIYAKATAANLCDIRCDSVNEIVVDKSFDIFFHFPTGNPNTFEVLKNFEIILTHKDNLLVYKYNVLDGSSKEIITSGDKNYSYRIYSDVIPDGEYNITIDAKDVVGGESHYFKNNVGDDYNNTPENGRLYFTLSYIIGEFGNVIVNDINPSNKEILLNEVKDDDTEIRETQNIHDDKEIHIEWSFLDCKSFSEAGDVDIFDITLEEII